MGQVKGLDPEAVAGQEQLLAVALPDGQGKHAVEPGQQVGTPGVVALEQHLGVAVAVEGIAEGFQLAAQFREVVDGAIEGQGQAQLRVAHGLRRTIGQVHDFQAAMAQGKWALAMEAPGVGATGREVVGDSFDGGEVRRLGGTALGGKTLVIKT
ncbi:hypothetical protein D9M71_322180 [compost metagenome]